MRLKEVLQWKCPTLERIDLLTPKEVEALWVPCLPEPRRGRILYHGVRAECGSAPQKQNCTPQSGMRFQSLLLWIPHPSLLPGSTHLGKTPGRSTLRVLSELAG